MGDDRETSAASERSIASRDQSDRAREDGGLGTADCQSLRTGIGGPLLQGGHHTALDNHLNVRREVGDLVVAVKECLEMFRCALELETGETTLGPAGPFERGGHCSRVGQCMAR